MLGSGSCKRSLTRCHGAATRATTALRRGRSPGHTNERSDMDSARYRSALRATVVASAAPYGYTLTIWTSGAVLSHAHGIPSSGEALLFLVGAVSGYALVSAIAFSEHAAPFAPEPSRAAMWGALHLFSVSLAIGAASVVAHVVHGIAAWPLGGLLATALYLLTSASQLVLVHAGRRERLAR